jgi:hypothetical protein
MPALPDVFKAAKDLRSCFPRQTAGCVAEFTLSEQTAEILLPRLRDQNDKRRAQLDSLRPACFACLRNPTSGRISHQREAVGPRAPEGQGFSPAEIGRAPLLFPRLPRSPSPDGLRGRRGTGTINGPCNGGAKQAAEKHLNAVILIPQSREKNLGGCIFNDLRRSFVACGSSGWQSPGFSAACKAPPFPSVVRSPGQAWRRVIKRTPASLVAAYRGRSEQCSA